MKYFASDIVKKARIAADLVNSDFITWYEEISLLNDTYVGLYQNLIEVNDASFVEVFETTNQYAVLPSDFYQLKSVTLVRNGYSTPVLRRSPSESYRSLSYEIRKDIIYFYSPLVQMQGGVYRVEYFRTPKTLTFKPEREEISYKYKEYKDEDLIYSGDFINANRDHIVYIDNQIIYIDDVEAYDLNKYNDLDELTGFITDKFLVYLFSYIPEDEDRFIDRAAVISLESKRPLWDNELDLRVPVIFEDGSVGIYKLEDGELIYSTNGAIIGKDVFNLPDSDEYEEGVGVIFSNMDFSDQWFYCRDKVLYHFDKKIVDANDNDILFKDVHYKRGTIYAIQQTTTELLDGVIEDTTYGENSVNIFRIYNDDTYDIQVMSRVRAIGNLDENTGLSYISYDRKPDEDGFDYTQLYVEPFVEDTLLDYPNSFFFQVITYALAVKYKVKQGADAAALTALYTQYLETFMRGANNDVYSPSRITNVYSI